MNEKKFSDVLGNISDRYIQEAITYKAANKRLLLLGSVAAILILSICAIAIFLLPHIYSNPNDDSHALEVPLSFSTFEELEAYLSTDGRDTPNGYYAPSSIPDGCTFSGIAMRQDVYITVHYHLDSSELVTSDMSQNAKERRTELFCVYYLFEDGSIALSQFWANDYKEIQYMGRTMYWRNEYDINDHKLLVGYNVVFLENGQLIYLHFPPLDTFENMLHYTEVTRIEIP